LTLIPSPISSSNQTSTPSSTKVLIVSIWIGDLSSEAMEDFRADIIKVSVLNLCSEVNINSYVVSIKLKILNLMSDLMMIFVA
jgi:hypothetical protein